MYRVWNFLSYDALLLVAGAALALAWANLAPGSYHDAVEFVLIEDFAIGHRHEVAGEVARTLTVQFLVNEMLMAIFFAVAAKEVWEALILRRGALRGRKAVTPLFATVGGMVAPVAVYLGLAAAMGSDAVAALSRGWAVPAATDIALTYVVGRLVFGRDHPAVRVLLLLAITDDLLAMALITVLHPADIVQPGWLLLSGGAVGAVYLLANWLPRRLDRTRPARPTVRWVRRRLGIWPYAAAGAASWYGFQQAGLSPALGLVPVVMAVPHADHAFGLFSEAEQYLGDLLNHFEQILKRPVEAILFLFALCNAGVDLGAAGTVTWMVLAALVLGKPAGVILFGWLAAGPLRLGLPDGVRFADLALIGMVAGIGFTVPLLIASDAFSGGATLDGIDAQGAAKLGAMLSLAVAPVAVALGWLLRAGTRRG